MTLALIPVPSHVTPISFATILMIPTGFPDGKEKNKCYQHSPNEKGLFFTIDVPHFDADAQGLFHSFLSKYFRVLKPG